MTLPKPTDYRTIQLSGDRRRALNDHARATLHTPDEEAAEAEAHAQLLAVSRAVIEDIIPETDMVVLRKYGHAQMVRHIRFRDVPSIDPERTRESSPLFCFCPRDTRSSQNAETRTGCHRAPVPPVTEGVEPLHVPTTWTEVSGLYYPNGSHETVQALDIGKMPKREQVHAALMDDLLAWLRAKVTTDRARDAILRPLYSLVHTRKTLQSLAEVWPEAMRLADRFEGVRLADEAGAQIVAAATFAPADVAAK